ncbi:response regulator transcription factor, partial [Chloroflexota bacterium]
GFVTTTPEHIEESYGSLTRREKEVLRLAASGQTNREMAETLFLSIRTVEKYRQAVMHKLSLARREDLTKYAIRRGLIPFE